MSEGRSLWAGRLPGGLAPEAWEFLHSLPYDASLWADDITGTMAHVRGLEEAEVLTRSEALSLLDELAAMADHPELIEQADEDVHSAIERVLTERLGPLGAKVHAGRSRNDQVATAMRLRTRREVLEMWEALCLLGEAVATRAADTATVLAPGYTHLQRAQPTTVGHWLSAHGSAFLRDAERFRAAYRAADHSPLGAGALAGNTLGTDPRVAAGHLGFSEVFRNTIDAVSDRDFLLDAAYAATVAVSHLSRLAEEIVVWSSSEFGFVLLPERYATGSSMMPQKRNPDALELARGSAARTLGDLVAMLAVLKGLPTSYNKDLQDDKRALFDATDTMMLVLPAVAGAVNEMSFDAQRMRAALSATMMATDVADYLVEKGVPFRDAHRVVGSLVRLAEERGSALDALPFSDFQAAHDRFDRDVTDWLQAERSVARREIIGGTGPNTVRAQLEEARRSLQK